MLCRLARGAVVALSAALGACSTGSSTAPTVTITPNPALNLRPPGTGAVATLTLTSSAFTNGGALPASAAQNGCGGTNVSPQLSWTAGPAGTQAYVVQVFDPDAPTGVGFWHWNLVNVPATTTSVPAGFGTTAAAPPMVEAETDYGTSGYGGPCPPVGDGPHHYFFTVSALNAPLAGIGPTATGAFITFSMRGTILAQGQIVGTYGR